MNTVHFTSYVRYLEQRTGTYYRTSVNLKKNYTCELKPCLFMVLIASINGLTYFKYKNQGEKHFLRMKKCA
jgi:hypothetical protein